jgi:hypothetical protein
VCDIDGGRPAAGRDVGYLEQLGSARYPDRR